MISIKDLNASHKSIEYENLICEKLKKIGVAKPEATTSNFAFVCTFYFWLRLTGEGKKYSKDSERYQTNIGERDGVWQILYNVLGDFELLEGFERNFYISLVGNDDDYKLPLNLDRVKGNNNAD
jgi:hypothetical protein